jgi:hypothetical protein
MGSNMKHVLCRSVKQQCCIERLFRNPWSLAPHFDAAGAVRPSERRHHLSELAKGFGRHSPMTQRALRGTIWGRSHFADPISFRPPITGPLGFLSAHGQDGLQFCVALPYLLAVPSRGIPPYCLGFSGLEIGRH